MAGCGHSDSHLSKFEIYADHCERARYGELVLAQITSTNPTLNSFLFSCAISVVVPTVDESAESVKTVSQKKTRLANSIAARGLHMDYRDEHGNTLLANLVLSFLPANWRQEKAETVISKGVDIDARNAYGKTALQLAKVKGDQAMVDLLTRLSVITSP